MKNVKTKRRRYTEQELEKLSSLYHTESSILMGLTTTMMKAADEAMLKHIKYLSQLEKLKNRSLKKKAVKK